MSAAAALWDRLAAQDFVAGAPPADDGDRAPWYVTAMVGTAAWIAALFLLVFIGSLTYALVHSLDAPLPIGVAICVPAVALLRMRASGLFLRQLAVAMSLAGQALVVFGLTDHHLRDPLAWLAVALFEAALVTASRETVHRALAALACLVALRIAALTGGAERIGPGGLNAFYFPSRPRPEEPQLPASIARCGFSEVVGTLPWARAVHEAGRCVSCGACTDCDTCLVLCPERVIARGRAGGGYMVDLARCTGCAICVAECPRGAMTMTPEPRA